MTIKKLDDGRYEVDIRPAGRNGKRIRRKVQVGERLTAVARREDIVGRLGGDEFLIVGSAQQPAAQQAYVTSLRQALCGVYFLGEQRIDYEGASFGVVTCDPQSIDVEAALRAADEAMYQDKKSRRQENFIHID